MRLSLRPEKNFEFVLRVTFKIPPSPIINKRDYSKLLVKKRVNVDGKNHPRTFLPLRFFLAQFSATFHPRDTRSIPFLSLFCSTSDHSVEAFIRRTLDSSRTHNSDVVTRAPTISTTPPPFFSPRLTSDFDESVARSISCDDSIGARPRNVDQQQWRGAHVPPHFQFHFIKRDCPSQNA